MPRPRHRPLFVFTNFGRLNTIRNGSKDDVYPDYSCTAYDSAGNLKGMAATQTNAGTYTFTYDEINRLKTAGLSGAGAANFSYTYGYDFLGNITRRTGSDPDMTYAYGEQTTAPVVQGGPQAVTRVDNSVGADWSYDYDARGNLDSKYVGTTLTYDYTFDVERRLASVETNNQTTTFAYAADGQRVMPTRPAGDGTVVITPFPDFEMEDPPGAGARRSASPTAWPGRWWRCARRRCCTTPTPTDARRSYRPEVKRPWPAGTGRYSPAARRRRPPAARQ